MIRIKLWNYSIFMMINMIKIVNIVRLYHTFSKDFLQATKAYRFFLYRYHFQTNLLISNKSNLFVALSFEHIIICDYKSKSHMS